MVDDLLIPRRSRVREAMRQLEVTESKTLFVVDEDQTLFGTLTDGDVRRWILGGGDLDGLAESVCNRAPFVVTDAHDREALRRTMLANKFSSVPVVDGYGRVVDVVLWEHVLGEETEVRAHERIDLPVVIMAGGFGTRMSPFTSVLPKPLVPIGGKTVIETIMASFTEFGVGEFFLSVNYKAKIIKSYFEELDPPYTVNYLHEDQPLGTAGSLRGLIGRVDDDFIVTNCDVIVSADYHHLVEHHRKERNDITLVVSLKNFKIPYGVCEIENGGKLREIREKPEYDFLVNTGLYVLTPAVLERIPPGEFFHVTDLIAAIQGDGGKVGVYPISDKAWVDTGEWSEYRAAVAELSADRRRSPR